MVIICLPLVYNQCPHFSQLQLWYPSPIVVLCSSMQFYVVLCSSMQFYVALVVVVLCSWLCSMQFYVVLLQFYVALVPIPHCSSMQFYVALVPIPHCSSMQFYADGKILNGVRSRHFGERDPNPQTFDHSSLHRQTPRFVLCIT